MSARSSVSDPPPRTPLPPHGGDGGDGGGGGGLVRVAWAANQAEAELLEQLLAAEGIPCLVRRPVGVDVPEMIAAGPRELLVPRQVELAAREALLDFGPLEDTGVGIAPIVRPLPLLAALIATLAVVALLVWLIVG